jgi:hypothetical protein
MTGALLVALHEDFDEGASPGAGRASCRCRRRCACGSCGGGGRTGRRGQQPGCTLGPWPTTSRGHVKPSESVTSRRPCAVFRHAPTEDG